MNIIVGQQMILFYKLLLSRSNTVCDTREKQYHKSYFSQIY